MLKFLTHSYKIQIVKDDIFNFKLIGWVKRVNPVEDLFFNLIFTGVLSYLVINLI